MKEVEVELQDTRSPVISHQCEECGYFTFDEKSINKAIKELKVKEMAMCNIKSVVDEDFELSDNAKNVLKNARETPESSYLEL